MNLKEKKYLLLDLDGVCYGKHNNYSLEKVFGQVSNRMTQFISEKLNSELTPSSSSLGPPTPKRLTSEFFFISFIKPAPNLSPECSPQTTPIFKGLLVGTYLKIPLSETSIDLTKEFK